MNGVPRAATTTLQTEATFAVEHRAHFHLPDEMCSWSRRPTRIRRQSSRALTRLPRRSMFSVTRSYLGRGRRNGAAASALCAATGGAFS